MCNLEVDVNGQETFFVSMKILASFSRKFQNMFNKSVISDKNGSLKLIFSDFPGGPGGFELIVQFCYSGGRIGINSSNALLLHCAAKFLEINEDQTEKYFENVHFWTWFEILDCLKHSPELFSPVNINSSYVVQEILDALVGKISMLNNYSPFSFSSSSIQFSGDISSTNSSNRRTSFQTNNWLRDLEFLSIFLFEKVLSTMIMRKLDHAIVCSFLHHYQKAKFLSVDKYQRCKIIEVMITSLSSLDKSFNLFPFRSLFHMLQMCLSLKMEKSWLKKVEKMIGSRMDEATLDDLLVPSHGRSPSAYDVDLIIRFLKIFVGQSGKSLFDRRLKKVGFLMDLYLAEVAPDFHLKPCKFLALFIGLPDTARESHDRVYEAIDMYFKVHKFLSENEKIKICSALNFEKPSSESLAKLAKNIAEFPGVLKSNKILEYRSSTKLSSNEKILLHFSMEKLECWSVQKTSANVDRVNVACPTSSRSLPRLCS